MENTQSSKSNDTCLTTQCCNGSKEMAEKVIAFAKEKPVLSLSLAVGVGMLIGAIRRRS